MTLIQLLNVITIDTDVVVLTPDRRSLNSNDVIKYADNEVAEVTVSDNMLFILIKEN